MKFSLWLIDDLNWGIKRNFRNGWFYIQKELKLEQRWKLNKFWGFIKKIIKSRSSKLIEKNQEERNVQVRFEVQIGKRVNRGRLLQSSNSSSWGGIFLRNRNLKVVFAETETPKRKGTSFLIFRLRACTTSMTSFSRKWKKKTLSSRKNKIESNSWIANSRISNSPVKSFPSSDKKIVKSSTKTWPSKTEF